MRKLLQLGFMVALIASGSGCFPYHYTTLPGISGKVVNEETLNPLADAQVFFSLTNPAFVAHSVDDGTFFAKPKKQWGIWIIAQDVFPRPCSIYIRRPGYQTDCVNFLFNPAGGKKRAKGPGNHNPQAGNATMIRRPGRHGTRPAAIGIIPGASGAAYLL